MYTRRLVLSVVDEFDVQCITAQNTSDYFPSMSYHMTQLMPLLLTVSCFGKIQIGLTFLVPAHPGSPGKGPLSARAHVCVCVCYHPDGIVIVSEILTINCYCSSMYTRRLVLSVVFKNYIALSVAFSRFLLRLHTEGRVHETVSP